MKAENTFVEFEGDEEWVSLGLPIQKESQSYVEISWDQKIDSFNKEYPIPFWLTVGAISIFSAVILTLSVCKLVKLVLYQMCKLVKFVLYQTVYTIAKAIKDGGK